jgi:RHS repeat-associated protein
MFYNADSGLYLTQYRGYDPVAGRWLSRDPVGEGTDPAGNLYAYVGGNPTGWIDPYGRQAVAGALPLAGGAAVADGPAPFGDILAVCILGVAGVIDLYDYIVNSSDSSSSSKPPFTGKPGSSQTWQNPDGTPKQTRIYGPDGYPAHDIDYGHDHGQGIPHVHDWTRPADGSAPTADDRQVGRPPKEGECECSN